MKRAAAALVFWFSMAPDAFAQLPCSQPPRDAYECVKNAQRAQQLDFCLLLIKEHIEELKKWRSCQLEEADARHSKQVSDIIQRVDESIRITNELMYCVGSTGKRNPACPF